MAKNLGSSRSSGSSSIQLALFPAVLLPPALFPVVVLPPALFPVVLLPPALLPDRALRVAGSSEGLSCNSAATFILEWEIRCY